MYVISRTAVQELLLTNETLRIKESVATQTWCSVITRLSHVFSVDMLNTAVLLYVWGNFKGLKRPCGEESILFGSPPSRRSELWETDISPPSPLSLNSLPSGQSSQEELRKSFHLGWHINTDSRLCEWRLSLREPWLFVSLVDTTSYCDRGPLFEKNKQHTNRIMFGCSFIFSLWFIVAHCG